MTGGEVVTGGPVPDGITHVLVGFSVGVLGQLDRVLPAGSVLVVEDPEICAARDVPGQLARFGCAAGLVQAPTQNPADGDRLAGLVPRPPQVAAVLPGLEYTVVSAASLARAWALPHGGIRAVAAFRDKALLRETVHARGIAQPQWRRVTGPQDVAEFRAEHGGACVLKPSHLQGSNGVQLLGPDDALDEAWRLTTAADETHLRSAHAAAGSYLVEEWLHGPEFSVEALVYQGRVVFHNATETQLYPGRHPVECGHIVPAALDAEAGVGAGADMPLEAMRKLVAATGFENGILHAEWILRDGTPHLLECAARLPGGYIPLLIALAYDCDPFRGYLDTLEGREPVLKQHPVGAAAVRFLDVRPGRVREIHGVDEARALPGVFDVWLSVQPGDTVSPMTGSWSRAGEVVAMGADRAEAAAAALAASRMVRIVTEAE